MGFHDMMAGWASGFRRTLLVAWLSRFDTAAHGGGHFDVVHTANRLRRADVGPAPGALLVLLREGRLNFRQRRQRMREAAHQQRPLDEATEVDVINRAETLAV